MNSKNKIKNQVNKALNSDHENQNHTDNSGIYLRDDGAQVEWMSLLTSITVTNF